MNNNQQELFTELTPSQGAAVSGGANLYVHSIFAVTAKRQDDLYLKFNGDKIFGTKKDVKSQQYIPVHKNYRFYRGAGLETWDWDRGPWNDDKLNSKWISTTPTNGYKVHTVLGNGYEYRITYKVS